MSGLARFRAQNHPQQTAIWGASTSIDERGTTPELFNPLNERFHFTIDVAAVESNAKCERFYTPTEDGLIQSWTNERVWCNPPYSSVAAWIDKAWRESDGSELIVMLLPANRTEQGWWQDRVEPFRDRHGSSLRSEFIRDRRPFAMPGMLRAAPNSRPPFGLVLLIWGVPLPQNPGEQP